MCGLLILSLLFSTSSLSMGFSFIVFGLWFSACKSKQVATSFEGKLY